MDQTGRKPLATWNLVSRLSAEESGTSPKRCPQEHHLLYQLSTSKKLPCVVRESTLATVRSKDTHHFLLRLASLPGPTSPSPVYMETLDLI